MSMLVEITEDYEKYDEVYRYINSVCPNDLHLHSVYNLTSFENTIRMLRYDIKGEIYSEISVTKDVERIAYFSDGKVKGMAIRAVFGEFLDVLDYEDYIVIIANTIEAFRELYKKIKRTNSKAEIITYREKERTYLKKYISNSEIHYWKVYEITPVHCEKEYEIFYSLFSQNDIDSIPAIATDETNPFRYKVFYDNEIRGYSVWTLFEDGHIPVLAASIIPYVGRIAEIKLYIINEDVMRPDNVVAFLRGIISNSSDDYDKAILRIKNTSNAINSILECGKFECISEEQHIHIRED